jgi:hypothetical protein
MSNTISNNDDIIDSRDVIARIEELESERPETYESEETPGVYGFIGCESDSYNSEEGAEVAGFAHWALENPEDADELTSLQALANECEGYGDWAHGEALIARSYWVDYVQELLASIGDIPQDVPDYVVIDWEATASNIEADYMSVDFDGTEYLMRS